MWIQPNARAGSRATARPEGRRMAHPVRRRKGLREWEGLSSYSHQTDDGFDVLGTYQHLIQNYPYTLDGFNLGKSLKKAVNSVKKSLKTIANPIVLTQKTVKAIAKNPLNPLKQVKAIIATPPKAAKITATVTPPSVVDTGITNDTRPWMPKGQRRIHGVKPIVAAVPKTDVPAPRFIDTGSSGGGGGGGGGGGFTNADSTGQSLPTVTPDVTTPPKSNMVPILIGALALGLSFMG